MQNLNDKTALGLQANVGAMLCYVGNLVCSLGLIYSIIVVITDKTNKLARFHAWQSILTNVLGLIVGLVGGVIAAIGGIIDSQLGFPILTLIVVLIVSLISIVFFVFYILAAIKAYQGQMYKIPIIGGFAEKWA